MILGTVLGAIIGTMLTYAWALRDLTTLSGFSFSRLMKYAHRKGFIDRESYIAQYVALALFTVGATNSLGNDDLLAAFAAGVPALRHAVFLYLFLV